MMPNSRMLNAEFRYSRSQYALASASWRCNPIREPPERLWFPNKQLIRRELYLNRRRKIIAQRVKLFLANPSPVKQNRRQR